MSASLPKGTSATEAARRYDVATQLSSTASVSYSFPTAGSAILTEEIINGVRKELMDAIIRAGNLAAWSFKKSVLPVRSVFNPISVFHKFVSPSNRYP